MEDTKLTHIIIPIASLDCIGVSLNQDFNLNYLAQRYADSNCPIDKAILQETAKKCQESTEHIKNRLIDDTFKFMGMKTENINKVVESLTGRTQ